MAAPSFVQASTGATDAGGAWTATGAAGTSGNIVILQVLQDGSTSGAIGLALTASHIQNLGAINNTWTYIGSYDVGNPVAGYQHLWIGRLIDTSAPTATSSNSTSEDLYWRFYEFSTVSTGTTLATVIENATAGSTTVASGSSNTASDASVQTLGPDRLALNFVGVNDDNVISIFSSAGLQGWGRIPATGPYADAGGTDGAIGVMGAYPGSICAGVPQGSIVVADTSSDAQRAQQFTTSGALTVAYVTIACNKQGTPGDSLAVEIQTDSGGVPSGTVVGSGGSVAGSAITETGTTRWQPVRVAVSASLSAATTYHLVVRRTGSTDIINYYNLGYAGDVLTATDWGYETLAGTWQNTSPEELCFSLQTSSDVSSGCTIDGGSGSIVDIDAWGVVGFALIGTTVVLDQQHYRFRNDDGNETTATWLADLDTDVN